MARNHTALALSNPQNMILELYLGFCGICGSRCACVPGGAMAVKHQKWPQPCVFGHPGPEEAEADGNWLATVQTCRCTRCALVQLCMDQSKESGRIAGLMSRVKDLEKENAEFKKEHAEFKCRLVHLERANKDLLELAANFQQVYKSKKHHKRKIQNSVEPKNMDPDLDSMLDKLVTEEDNHPGCLAMEDSQCSMVGVAGVPGTPA